MVQVHTNNVAWPSSSNESEKKAAPSASNESDKKGGHTGVGVPGEALTTYSCRNLPALDLSHRRLLAESICNNDAYDD